MAGLDVLYDCYDKLSAVLACEFEGLHSLHWGTAWMYRECPNGEWLVWSLGRAAMLLMWGFVRALVKSRVYMGIGLLSKTWRTLKSCLEFLFP